MGTFIDLTGKIFGKLLVIKKSFTTNKGTRVARINWLCQCECGNKKSIPGHDLKSGAINSCGCNAYKWVSEAKLAEKNPMWKGDKVGYQALHGWVRRRLHKTKLCEKCHKSLPYDLANRSGKYLRDLSDWEWLCRRCHMLGDGRMKNLRSNKK